MFSIDLETITRALFVVTLHDDVCHGAQPREQSRPHVRISAPTRMAIFVPRRAREGLVDATIVGIARDEASEHQRSALQPAVGAPPNGAAKVDKAQREAAQARMEWGRGELAGEGSAVAVRIIPPGCIVPRRTTQIVGKRQPTSLSSLTLVPGLST